MKKTLYLMRHGQTLFNLQHKIQGWCDAPLTPLGIAFTCLVFLILFRILIHFLYKKWEKEHWKQMREENEVKYIIIK